MAAKGAGGTDEDKKNGGNGEEPVKKGRGRPTKRDSRKRGSRCIEKVFRKQER